MKKTRKKIRRKIRNPWNTESRWEIEINPVTGIIKNKTGRPLLYTDPKQMEENGLKYFQSCWKKKYTGKGKKKEWIQVEPYTITGLALALGMTRLSLLNYEKNFPERREFFNIVKKLKMYCEKYAENSLFKGHAAGPIFNLYNNYKGWKQKQENTLVGDNEKPVMVANVNMTDEEATRLYMQMMNGKRK